MNWRHNVAGKTIKEIQAKTLLARLKRPDDWFGLYYNMNL